MTPRKRKNPFVPPLSERTVFLKYLNSDDSMGFIVRGHLYIESALMQLIEEAPPDPGAIDLTRFNFPLKLDLAVALGLMSESETRGYLRLNSLRNKHAHNLGVALSEDDQRNLFQSLDQLQRDKIRQIASPKKLNRFPELSRWCIASLYLTMRTKLEKIRLARVSDMIQKIRREQKPRARWCARYARGHFPAFRRSRARRAPKLV